MKLVLPLALASLSASTAFDTSIGHDYAYVRMKQEANAKQTQAHLKKLQLQTQLKQLKKDLDKEWDDLLDRKRIAKKKCREAKTVAEKQNCLREKKALVKQIAAITAIDIEKRKDASPVAKIIFKEIQQIKTEMNTVEREIIVAEVTQEAKERETKDKEEMKKLLDEVFSKEQENIKEFYHGKSHGYDIAMGDIGSYFHDKEVDLEIGTGPTATKKLKEQQSELGSKSESK